MVVEEFVYVLDFLPKGRGDAPPHRRYPVVYGLGENQFTLLELIPKSNITLNIGDRIYVGNDGSGVDNLDGNVDDPFVLSRVLDPAEIAKMYQTMPRLIWEEGCANSSGEWLQKPWLRVADPSHPFEGSCWVDNELVRMKLNLNRNYNSTYAVPVEFWTRTNGESCAPAKSTQPLDW